MFDCYVVGSTSVPSSQPITVQIQHTDQGTRLVVSSQLSQIPQGKEPNAILIESTHISGHDNSQNLK